MIMHIFSILTKLYFYGYKGKSCFLELLFRVANYGKQSDLVFTKLFVSTKYFAYFKLITKNLTLLGACVIMAKLNLISPTCRL